MEIKNLYKSKKVRYAVGSIVVLGLFLLVFQAGVFLGYHRAIFSGNLGNNYARTFEGLEGEATSTDSWGHMFRRDVPGGHGAVGQIVKVNLPTIVLATSNNVEEIIRLSGDTVIRHFMDSATSTDLKLGDTVVVIGAPNSQGEIDARLVRIMQ
jgi:hypothetical protein